MAGFLALIFTAFSPTTGNARHGWRASPRDRPMLPMTLRSSARSMRSRRTLPRISILIACLNSRDEHRRRDGEDCDQDCVGAAIKRERAADVGGIGVPTAAAHRGIVDAHAIDTRA